MKIIKRNGVEQEFNAEKIRRVITLANQSVSGDKRVQTEAELEKVFNYVLESISSFGTVAVETIQDKVRDAFMNYNYFDVADSFIKYRQMKANQKKFNESEEKILAIVNNFSEDVKQDNANKNPVILSTQRDYIAGTECKAIARKTLPKEIIDAHDRGLIHWHDMDYSPVQHMSNCFIGWTEFITDKGIRRFDSFKNGEKVTVKTKDGNWSEATVRYYGRQRMNQITLNYCRGQLKEDIKIVCTPNHRWILEDGTVTTDLQIGDRLYNNYKKFDTDLDALTSEEAFYFCLGFVIDDGFDSNGQYNDYTRIRLCDYKIQYKDIFLKAGYYLEENNYENDDLHLIYKGALKQNFLNGYGWRYLNKEQKTLLFNGLYAANGGKNHFIIWTTDKREALLIKETAEIAGFYILSEYEEIRSTNYKDNVLFYNFRFYQMPKKGYGWYVKDIRPYKHGKEKNCWCVEEPTTHSFMLKGGIVTGNCCLVNLKDMLENGFEMNGVFIDSPKSFRTACTLATQVAAQVAGQQYGGQTMSWTHIAKYVDVSRQKIYNKQKAHHPEWNEEMLNDFVETLLRDEICDGVQTFQYQVLTILCSNGQTPFISMSMNFDECEGDERLEKDASIVFEEVLRQRIEGLDDGKGNKILAIFPKLLYFLDECNALPESKYYWLTKMAVECASKRMAPDFISAKIQRKLKHTEYTWPCMGCVHKDSIVTVKLNGKKMVLPFDLLYEKIRCVDVFSLCEKEQSPGSPHHYIDTSQISLTVYDSFQKRYVKVFKLIKNDASHVKWMKIILKDAHSLICTSDHIISSEKYDEVKVNDLTYEDRLFVTCNGEMIPTEIESILPYKKYSAYSYDMETESSHFDVNNIYTHNCRSFLTPYTPSPMYDDEKLFFGKYYKEISSPKELFSLQENSGESLKYKFIRKSSGEVNEIDHFEKDENGRVKLILRDKYYGRNNNGVVSINLPHVALESKGVKADFWRILDSRLELVYRALVERYKSLKGALAEAAPIMRRFGAIFRLKAKDPIDHFITGPYCTYSLGYVGLWETCMYMTHTKLSDDQSFANEILNFFNKKHDEWHTRLMNPNNPNSWLNTSTYGTPEEQLTTKFACANKRDFGEVEGVTDHDYVTNSYHINPAQPIDAFSKISIESKLQDKSTGGAISYVELPNMDNNLEAVEAVVQFMYNKILYCELNIRRDICYRCNYHGEIKMIKEDGKYIWECPVCKNRDNLLMDIKRRVCGYIADAKTGMSQGRMGDMYVRVYHLN